MKETKRSNGITECRSSLMEVVATEIAQHDTWSTSLSSPATYPFRHTSFAVLIRAKLGHEIGFRRVLKNCAHWRPSRWIQLDGSDLSNTETTLKHKTLIVPPKGSFIACSEGIRNCPGKKISEMEFVASMVEPFRDWQVDPVPEGSETSEMGRTRVMEMVTGQVLLLHLLHPERAALTWKRR